MTREEKNAKRRAYYARTRDQYAHRREKYKNDRAKWAKKRYAEFRELVDGIKARNGCSVCGEHRIPCLDFHHKDREQKLFSIGRGWGRNPKTVLAEVEKCILLCANCHRVLHYSKDAETQDSGAIPGREVTHGRNHNNGVHAFPHNPRGDFAFYL